MTWLDRRRFTKACIMAAAGAFRPPLARAQDVPDKPPSTGHLNPVTPTLGAFEAGFGRNEQWVLLVLRC